MDGYLVIHSFTQEKFEWLLLPDTDDDDDYGDEVSSLSKIVTDNMLVIWGRIKNKEIHFNRRKRLEVQVYPMLEQQNFNSLEMSFQFL